MLHVAQRVLLQAPQVATLEAVVCNLHYLHLLVRNEGAAVALQACDHPTIQDATSSARCNQQRKMQPAEQDATSRARCNQQCKMQPAMQDATSNARCNRATAEGSRAYSIRTPPPHSEQRKPARL
jgi:hypothetical protein